MWKIFAATVICVVLSGVYVDAADCCAGYTDAFGDYHPTQLCENYCCLHLSLSKYVQCCADPTWQAPATQRSDECLESWISEHVWVPIVGVVIFVLIVIGICTCCCCCGCCACCRRSPQPVIVHSAGGGPQTTVAMQQSTIQANPIHYGYDQ